MNVPSVLVVSRAPLRGGGGGGDLAPAQAGLSPRRISDSHCVKCIFPPAFSQLTCRENNSLL